MSDPTTGEILEILNTKADQDLKNVDRFYYFYKYAQFTLASGASTSQSIQYTPITGKPVFINISGDNNPTSSSGWCQLNIYKDNVLLTRQICASVSASCNIPFNVFWLDTNPTECVYKVEIYQGGGTSIYGEDGNYQAPQIVIFEI